MMELADLATVAFIVSGVAYQGMKYWRSDKRVCLKREIPVSLMLRDAMVPESYLRAVVIVFDRRGYLIRKFPDTDIIRCKNKCKLRCSSAEGVVNFCVLFTPHTLNLSGIYTRADIDRLFSGKHDIFIAETGLQEIYRSISLELMFVSVETTKETEHEAVPVTLSLLLPPGLVTDAMAKELFVDLQHCSESWSIGNVLYCAKNEPDNWLALRREGEKLVLQLRTNFCDTEREASVELYTEGGTHLLKVRQQVMGMCSTLTVARRLYVSAGQKSEMVPITVIPDNEESHWRIRSANVGDGGCWYTVHPPVGIYQKGTKILKIHLEAKPANVRSRSLALTLETGTYPFSQTTEITLMQGVCFEYYIEYPQNDLCARHSRVIEMPPGNAKDELNTYTVCVDSNQPWRIIHDKQIDWMEVGDPELLPGLYDGRFTVRVQSNGGNKVKNGFPAARHTVLSLVNDTGIVKDILIYQGGYVRIRGQYWLDRNLAAGGKLAQVAIPLGLEEGSTLNYGSYFQFGCRENKWSETFNCCKGNWYEGTAENPSRMDRLDPSPVGWRVPSHIEMEAFINRTVAPMELQREEDRTNICILSDDGVPVYLPLCGHRSHINGCKIIIPHGHRYWTGSSQSPVYGYSLCVEPRRQMYIMHDMKKYGFPVRCVLDGE